MKKRLILDALMCVFIVLALLNQLTGQFAHEVIGAVLIVAAIVHACLGAKTFKAIKGKSRGATALFYLLVVALVLLTLSALIISRILMVAGSYLSDLDSGGGYIWSKVHVVSAYAFAALVAFHIALHWATVLSALGRKGPHTSKLPMVVAFLVAALLAVLCARTLYLYATSSDSSGYQPSNGVTEQLEEAYSSDEDSSTGESGAEGLGVYGAGDPRAKSDGSKSPDLGSPDDEASSADSSEESGDAQSFIDAVSSATQ